MTTASRLFVKNVRAKNVHKKTRADTKGAADWLRLWIGPGGGLIDESYLLVCAIPVFSSRAA
jgi:hypothetical protein